jgi:hypothetical protein
MIQNDTAKPCVRNKKNKLFFLLALSTGFSYGTTLHIHTHKELLVHRKHQAWKSTIVPLHTEMFPSQNDDLSHAVKTCIGVWK